MCLKRRLLKPRTTHYPTWQVKPKLESNQLLRPLQDPVTWYGINYIGTQMTQWDFQNKGKSGWTGKSSFVLEVPLGYLRPSIIYSVPCDRILQMTYLSRIYLQQTSKHSCAYFKTNRFSELNST